MARFASKTKVPVTQSRAEIERSLERYGATAFAYAMQEGRATIMFEASGRRVRFVLPLPDAKLEQAIRQKWRALLLCIKAKLESVESEIETFEDAFMSHIVMPDGQTVGDHVGPKIAEAYLAGRMTPLLAPPGKDNYE